MQADNAVFFDIKGVTNTAYRNNQSVIRIKSKKPVSFINIRKHSNCSENLHAGNTYLINLTFPTEIGTDSDLKIFFKYPLHHINSSSKTVL